MPRLIAVLLLLTLSTSLVAAEETWIGQQVFWKNGAKAKVGTQEVGIENIPFPATVEEVSGPWLWLGRAWILKSDLMRTPEALQHYTDLIKREPKDAGWRRRRGAVWASQGEWDSAIQDYSEAIRIEPAGAAAFNNRGIAYSAKRDFDKAIDDFSEAIRLDPKRASYYNGRGTAWNEMGEFDKAIEDYTQAIKLDPGYAVAYNNRGAAWIGKDDYSLAIDDYTTAIGLDSKYAAAFENRGDAWNHQGHADKAAEDLSDALAQNPKNVRARCSRGLARSRLGQFEQALEDYTQAIELDSQAISAFNGRAWLRATCPDAKYRNGAEAVKDATAACELVEWKQAGMLDTLAVSYAESGDFPAAIKWQQKALEVADESLKPELTEHLKLFQAGKPYHAEPKS
jgi:tetratricopeptide (TPR) repeat protein